MTRLALTVGRLRLRLIGGLALVLTLLTLAERYANQFLLQMNPVDLDLQTWSWMLYSVAYLALMTFFVRLRLRPLTAILTPMRAGDPLAKLDRAAGTAAIRFPVEFGLFGVGAAVGLIASKLLLDLLLFELDLALALTLMLRALAMTACAAVVLYSLARHWLRPVVSAFHAETVPSGPRVTLRGKVSFVLFAALAPVVPAMALGAARVAVLEHEAQTRYRKHLADAVAHGATLLAATALRDSVASIRLRRGRVRFSNRLSEEAAQLPPGERSQYLTVRPLGDRPDISGIDTITLVTLFGLLGLVGYVTRYLVQSLLGDLRSITSRVAALAGEDGNTAQHPDQRSVDLSPLPRAAPQFSDLRRLVNALNALLDRMAQINIAHYMAVEKALEASRVRTQFLANMSHDLRSPLSSILGFSELLLRGIDGELSAEQRDIIETMHSSGNHLLRLISNVLDAARVEAGRMGLHAADVPPAEIVTAALGALHDRGIPAAVEIETELQAGVPVICADGPRLAEALAHVLWYCADHAQAGRVALKVRTAPPIGDTVDLRLQFEISQDSVAPSAAEVEQLFVGFRRREGRAGLGLELWLARAFVELHGGRLTADAGPDRGHRFLASIPVRRSRAGAHLRDVQI